MWCLSVSFGWIATLCKPRMPANDNCSAPWHGNHVMKLSSCLIPQTCPPNSGRGLLLHSLYFLVKSGSEAPPSRPWLTLPRAHFSPLQGANSLLERNSNFLTFFGQLSCLPNHKTYDITYIYIYIQSFKTCSAFSGWRLSSSAQGLCGHQTVSMHQRL